MKNVIISITLLLFISCNHVKALDESKELKPTDVVEINLDDMSFTKAFAIQHRAKGEGRTFWWRGNQYTTDLAVLDEFVLNHVIFGIDVVDSDRFGWVLNNDDPDDNCRSNKLDDCGVCDGPGKVTWFRDKDGDGLGTFSEWITSCTFPKDMEIERFHEESLQEGGGDQGVVGE